MGFGVWSQDGTKFPESGVCGTITRTWQPTPDCDNNFDPYEITYNIVDDVEPVLFTPESVTQECGTTQGDPTGTATATDNCDNVVDVTKSETGFDEFISYCQGKVNTITWTATDDCGNTATGVQTVTVVDTNEPTVSVPMDFTLECGVNEDLDTGSATGSDECDQDVTLTSSSSDFIGTSYCDGKVKTITWTATDVCGLSASDTQQITVKDTTKPTVSAPNDFILECGISSQNADTGTATGLDACDSSVVISSSSTGMQGTSFCESTGGMRNAITWTATDDCGFTDSAVQTITVYDKTAPTVLVPQDYTLECNVNQDMDTGSATVRLGSVNCIIVYRLAR